MLLLLDGDGGSDAHARAAPALVEHFVEQADEAHPVVDEAERVIESGIPVEEPDGDDGYMGFPDEPDGRILPVAFADGPVFPRFEVRDRAGREDTQGTNLPNLVQGVLDAVDARV